MQGGLLTVQSPPDRLEAILVHGQPGTGKTMAVQVKPAV